MSVPVHHIPPHPTSRESHVKLLWCDFFASKVFATASSRARCALSRDRREEHRIPSFAISAPTSLRLKTHSNPQENIPRFGELPTTPSRPDIEPRVTHLKIWVLRLFSLPRPITVRPPTCSACFTTSRRVPRCPASMA
jgi:hypothetical protein